MAEVQGHAMGWVGEAKVQIHQKHHLWDLDYLLSLFGISGWLDHGQDAPDHVGQDAGFV